MGTLLMVSPKTTGKSSQAKESSFCRKLPRSSALLTASRALAMRSRLLMVFSIANWVVMRSSASGSAGGDGCTNGLAATDAESAVAFPAQDARLQMLKRSIQKPDLSWLRWRGS